MRTVNLTLGVAFNEALECLKLKLKKKPDERAKLYVWKQRFNEDALSHKKICAIIQKAGFEKSIDEKWRKKVDNYNKKRLKKKR